MAQAFRMFPVNRDRLATLEEAKNGQASREHLELRSKNKPLDQSKTQKTLLEKEQINCEANVV